MFSVPYNLHKVIIIIVKNYQNKGVNIQYPRVYVTTVASTKNIVNIVKITLQRFFPFSCSYSLSFS